MTLIYKLENMWFLRRYIKYCLKTSSVFCYLQHLCNLLISAMSWSQEWQVVFSQVIFTTCFSLRIGLAIFNFVYNMFVYYSFIIFLYFWLAKITRIIHHNQLVFTKYGRILPYLTDDVKSAAKLQIIEPLTEEIWGRVWVVFEVSNGGTCYLFHSELLVVFRLEPK